jgi:hypothetical protein
MLTSLGIALPTDIPDLGVIDDDAWTLALILFPSYYAYGTLSRGVLHLLRKRGLWEEAGVTLFRCTTPSSLSVMMVPAEGKEGKKVQRPGVRRSLPRLG